MKQVYDPMEQLAVIVWGLLTVILLFAFALWQNAVWGAVASIAAAGCTYLFQVLVLEPGNSLLRIRLALLIAVLILAATSLTSSLFGV